MHKRSNGIPRLINVIADRALVAAYAHSLDRIGERTVNGAADEALTGKTRTPWVRWLCWSILALVAGLAAAWYIARPDVPEAAPEPVRPSLTHPEQLSEQQLEERLAGLTAESSWRALASRWQIDLGDNVAFSRGCPQGLESTVVCFRGSGSFSKLRQFGRPVLLLLRLDGKVLPVLLAGIDRERARLELAGVAVVVERETLRTYWSGEYRALYKLPASFPSTTRLRDQGEVVLWIRERLANALGEATTDSSEIDEASEVDPALVFDAAVERRVRDVQEIHGLLADGIVGPETGFALSRYADGGPRLQAVGDPPGDSP